MNRHPNDRKAAQDIAAEREVRRRQARGLLLLALVLLILSVLRAGVPRVFTVGWWHLW